jgi:hypothetical protein
MVLRAKEINEEYLLKPHKKLRKSGVCKKLIGKIEFQLMRYVSIMPKTQVDTLFSQSYSKRQQPHVIKYLSKDSFNKGNYE